MLRSGHAHQQKATARPWNLLVFSVGGRRLAVRTEEVAGISAWKEPIPIPSRTPFVTSVIRQDQTVVPVFDLAELLHVSVVGMHRLCITAKHPDGPMAICIDEDMPILHTVDRTTIQPYRGGEVCSIGCFPLGFDEIPILAVSELGAAV
jgi:chemotaxis signal transduction protein